MRVGVRLVVIPSFSAGIHAGVGRRRHTAEDGERVFPVKGDIDALRQFLCRCRLVLSRLGRLRASQGSPYSLGRRPPPASVCFHNLRHETQNLLVALRGGTWMSSSVRFICGDWLVGVGRRLVDDSRPQARSHSEVPSCWGSFLPSRDPGVSWPTSIGQDVLAQRILSWPLRQEALFLPLWL